MAATSAWRMDRVLPHVATRQWVVTVPWKRRWLLARRPKLASGVHTVALRTIERWYAAAGGAPKTGGTGSVTATQRFGSALNLDEHSKERAAAAGAREAVYAGHPLQSRSP